MQRVLNRFGLRAVAVLMFGIVLTTTSSLILAVSYRDQFTGLERAVYQQCVTRTGYDNANHQAVAGLLAYLLAQQRQVAIDAVTTRRLIATFPSSLRPAILAAQSRQAAQLARSVTALRVASRTRVIGNCRVYR